MLNQTIPWQGQDDEKEKVKTLRGGWMGGSRRVARVHTKHYPDLASTDVVQRMQKVPEKRRGICESRARKRDSTTSAPGRGVNVLRNSTSQPGEKLGGPGGATSGADGDCHRL